MCLDLVPREVLVPYQSPSGSNLLHIIYISQSRNQGISISAPWSSLACPTLVLKKGFFERLTMGSGRTMSCCHTALSVLGEHQISDVVYVNDSVNRYV